MKAVNAKTGNMKSLVLEKITETKSPIKKKIGLRGQVKY
jgi:hypothetical protein